MSEINRRRAQYVDDVPFGVYVWVLPSGAYFSDDEGNVLSIASKKGDLVRVQKLHDFAKIYGAPEGRAHFLSGHRKITDEEFGEQLWRMAEGMIPDQYDVGAYAGEQRLLQNGQ